MCDSDYYRVRAYIFVNVSNLECKARIMYNWDGT